MHRHGTFDTNYLKNIVDLIRRELFVNGLHEVEPRVQRHGRNTRLCGCNYDYNRIIYLVIFNKVMYYSRVGGDAYL